MKTQSQNSVTHLKSQSSNSIQLSPINRSRIDEPKRQEEEIFKSLCPKEKYINNDKCLVDNVLFDVTVKKRNCAFCGYQVCQSCSLRERENPQKKGVFARICDLCNERYLRRKIQQLEDDEQHELNRQIDDLELGLEKANQEHKKILQKKSSNLLDQEDEQFQQEDQMEHLDQQLQKLQKQLEQQDQKLLSIHQEEQTYTQKIKDTKGDILDIQARVQTLREKEQLMDSQILEHDSRIMELNKWLAETNKDLSNYNYNNKKFESFQVNQRGTGRNSTRQSSLWKEPMGTCDQNENGIFREDLEDSDEDYNQDYNSQEINKLLLDQ